VIIAPISGYLPELMDRQAPCREAARETHFRRPESGQM
jgi:hypothetical protein